MENQLAKMLIDGQDRLEQKLDALVQTTGDMRVETAQISAKVAALVGEDGNDGAFAELKKRVNVLDANRSYWLGAIGMIGVIAGLLGHWLLLALEAIHWSKH